MMGERKIAIHEMDLPPTVNGAVAERDKGYLIALNRSLTEAQTKHTLLHELAHIVQIECGYADEMNVDELDADAEQMARIWGESDIHEIITTVFDNFTVTGAYRGEGTPCKQ